MHVASAATVTSSSRPPLARAARLRATSPRSAREAKAEDEPAEAQAAADAGLRHVSDTEPGLRRRRAGKGFVYLDAKGNRITDAAVIARIRALAIPPA